MNKSFVAFCFSSIALLCFLANCGSRNSENSPGTTPPIPKQTHLLSSPTAKRQDVRKVTKIITSSASWAHIYELDDIVKSSDIIVEGTISDIKDTRAIPPLQTPSIFTDFKLNVAKVLKSYPGFNESSIVIIQMGGTYQDITHITEGDDLFQVGEQVLLFLRDASDDPVQTPNRDTKFAVLMPGGRFTIKENQLLDTPTKDSPVADQYRGKGVAVLENDIAASLPDSMYYVENAAHASLIVEGKVGDPESRLVELDDTQSVYTVYPFKVENIIYDDLESTKNAAHKSKVYQHLPVSVGDDITIFERGGIYKDIVQRWAWSWEMKSGSRMLLFLGILDCGNRPILCTQEEMDSNKAPYFAGGGARFLVNPDSTLTAITRDFFSRLYDGNTKDKLIHDLEDARINIQSDLDAKQKGVPDTNFPPPPRTPAK